MGVKRTHEGRAKAYVTKSSSEIFRHILFTRLAVDSSSVCSLVCGLVTGARVMGEREII